MGLLVSRRGRKEVGSGLDDRTLGLHDRTLGLHDRRLRLSLAAIAGALILACSAPDRAPAYSVVAWGSNQSGQLGNGSSGEDVKSPVLVRALRRSATSVAAGNDHSLATRLGGE